MDIKEIMKYAEEIEPEIIAHRRFLHQNPETGFNLSKTVSYIMSVLTDYGYKPEKCGKNGVVAVIGSGEKCTLLRADMDALPIGEQTELHYKSYNGNMHACGHDMHTAMLLGAAKILKKYESGLHNSVKLMFQPAEELLSGAEDMIKAGVLEKPAVGLAAMIHVVCGAGVDTGTAILASGGIIAPSADYFEIKVCGKSSHGAMSEKGVDPIIPAAHIITALSSVISNEIGISEKARLTLGKINGGTADNIIADAVTISGTLRAFDDNIRLFIRKRITEICENICSAFRAKTKVSFSKGCPALINDKAALENTTNVLKILMGENRVIEAGESFKSSGSEDFSYISQKAPSVMIALSAGDSGYPLHNPKVMFDEAALRFGSAVYTAIGMCS